MSLTDEEAREGLALLPGYAHHRLVVFGVACVTLVGVLLASYTLGRAFEAETPLMLAGVGATLLTLARARKRLDGPLEALRRAFTVHLGDGRLRVSAVSGTFDGPLTALAGRSESAAVLVLHLSPSAGFLLPKRQLSPEALSMLRASVAAYPPGSVGGVGPGPSE